MNVELRHLGGDVRSVEVTRAYLKNGVPVLDITWPLAGVYTLDLKRNELLRAPLWSALDVEGALTVWRLLSPPKQELRIKRR